MSNHHELVPPFSIHPIAFVGGTDPSLDADNFVTARKWWLDTGDGNALKVRNDTNDGWLTVISGGSQTGIAWNLKYYIDDREEWLNGDIDEFIKFTAKTYV